MARMFPLLARFKRLRGTPFDPFGYAAERRMERAPIKEYERDMTNLADLGRIEMMEEAIALAKLPLSIRGFGPVKDQNARAAAKTREDLLARMKAGPVRHTAE